MVHIDGKTDMSWQGGHPPFFSCIDLSSYVGQREKSDNLVSVVFAALRNGSRERRPSESQGCRSGVANEGNQSGPQSF